MFIHSIRWRLQLWLAFLLICALAGFAVTVYQLQSLHQLGQIDEALASRVSALSSAVRGPPPFGRGHGRRPFENGPGDAVMNEGPMRPPPPDSPEFEPPERGPDRRFRERERPLSPEAKSLIDAAGTSGFYCAVWSQDGKRLSRSTNAPVNLPAPEREAVDTRLHTRTRGSFREAFQFTEMGDCILAGRSITTYLSAMRRFTGLLLAVGGGVLAFGLGGAWWLAGRAIRPIAQISAAANRISAGHLSERISVAETDNELGRLAGVLNSTFGRLEAAFAQQKQFTADVSHDLRTPLAVIISEAQTALARERSAAEYRETLEGCLSTAQQMRKLTESLLELARFDAGQAAMQHKPFALAAVAQTCVELVRPLADRRGIGIDCDLPAVECLGDAERISQVITNLLTNAVEFNRDQGEIRVSVDADQTSAWLRVTDTGQGIPAADLPHIFERFYRVDKSRARSEGHNGLGLAICQAIVDAHGGNLEVTSQPGVGSTFTVRLPLQ